MDYAGDMWSDNKLRELIAVKVLHTSLLNTTVVAFKVLPLGSYALMPAPSPHILVPGSHTRNPTTRVKILLKMSAAE